MVLIDEIYDILFRFGGGRGGDPGNVAVRFLLPTFFWSILALVAFREWKRERDSKDLYVGIASLIGMSRELLMFTAEYGSWRGLINFEDIYFYYPPFEHAATMFSCIFIGAAFLRYLQVSERFVRTFFFSASVLTGILYVVIAPAWYNHLSQHPGVPFGLFWGDMAFRIAASIFMGSVVAVLLLISQEGRFIPRALIVGFTFLFLDEFLMIFNIASHERYVQYFAPLRHNLHIWAIPLFIAFYWSDLGRRVSEAEKMISNSFRLSPSMLSVFDQNGIVKVASPAAAAIAGAVPEQMLGQDIKSFFRSADGTDPLHSLKGSAEFEARFAMIDGSVRHLSWKVHRSSDDGYFYAAVSDSTRLKLAEEALAGVQTTAWIEKAKSDSILSAMEDGISIHDRDFRIIYQNRKFRQLMGDHIGEFCYEAYAKQKRICADCPMVECFRDSGTHISERPLAVNEGRKFFRITVFPMKDESGNIVGGIKMIRDINAGRVLESGSLQGIENDDVIAGQGASYENSTVTANEEPVPAAGRVLVMDDEAGVRDVAGEMLRSAGCRVEFAADGGRAVELYRKAMDEGDPFDAVVLDLTVPGGMGGRETIEKLVEMDPDVKAVVSSGYSDDAVMSDHEAYGFCGIVPKPYLAEDLCNAVFSAIRLRREINGTV